MNSTGVLIYSGLVAVFCGICSPITLVCSIPAIVLASMVSSIYALYHCNLCVCIISSSITICSFTTLLSVYSALQMEVVIIAACVVTHSFYKTLYLYPNIVLQWRLWAASKTLSYVWDICYHCFDHWPALDCDCYSSVLLLQKSWATKSAVNINWHCVSFNCWLFLKCFWNYPHTFAKWKYIFSVNNESG